MGLVCPRDKIIGRVCDIRLLTLLLDWQFALLHHVSTFTFTPETNPFATYSESGMQTNMSFSM